MKTLNIEKNYREEIKNLYDKFCEKYKGNKEVREILEKRGLIIVKELFYEPDLLILGLNPSWNRDHDEIVNKQQNISFWYPYIIPNEKGSENDIQNDHKFLKDKEFHITTYIEKNYYENYLKHLSLKNKWEYFDLFWVRVGGKDDEYKFSDLKSTELEEFLKEQIKISAKIIKEIHPKIIVGAYGSLGDFTEYTNNDTEFSIIKSKGELENILGNNSIDNKKIYVLKFLTSLPNPNRYDSQNNIMDYIDLTNKLLKKLKGGD
jgi:hypothetical protein